MRLLALLKFIPRQPWRPKYWLMMPRYIRFRLETMGARPTLREFWAYLGWCHEFRRYTK